MRMPNWIRTALYTVMLLCCVIIGARAYLALNAPDSAATVASRAGVPCPLSIIVFPLLVARTAGTAPYAYCTIRTPEVGVYSQRPASPEM